MGYEFDKESILKNLNDTYDKLRIDYDRLIEEIQISRDKFIDIHHYIELSEFNVPEGYFAVKKLKENLQEHRKAKSDIKSARTMLMLFEGRNNINETAVSIEDFDSEDSSIKESILDKIEDIDLSLLVSNFKNTSFDEDSEDSYAAKLSKMLVGYAEQKKKVLIGLKDVEERINDLNNKIEFSEFGLIEGYKLAKAMKGLRLERRKLKDERLLFEYLDEALFSNDKIKSTATSVNRVVKKRENRKYTPRVYSSYNFG